MLRHEVPRSSQEAHFGITWYYLLLLYVLLLTIQAGIAEKPADARILPSWAVKLWENNITPMSVIRTIGPFGPSLVRMYTDRRFHFLPPTENDALRDYLYHICAQKGSGEYALGVLLQPGAWGRRPMVNRVHKLTCPVTFICTSVFEFSRDTNGFRW